MESVGTVRAAVAAMHRDEDVRWNRVGDLLEAAVDRYEDVLATFPAGSRAGAATAAQNVGAWEQALAVARAYLERVSA